MKTAAETDTARKSQPQSEREPAETKTAGGKPYSGPQPARGGFTQLENRALFHLGLGAEAKVLLAALRHWQDLADLRRRRARAPGPPPSLEILHAWSGVRSRRVLLRARAELVGAGLVGLSGGGGRGLRTRYELLPVTVSRGHSKRPDTVSLGHQDTVSLEHRVTTKKRNEGARERAPLSLESPGDSGAKAGEVLRGLRYLAGWERENAPGLCEAVRTGGASPKVLAQFRGILAKVRLARLDDEPDTRREAEVRRAGRPRPLTQEEADRT